MKLKIFLTVFIALGFTVSQAQPAKPIPGQYIVILKESAATPVIKQETQIITVCKRPQITLWSSILASLNHVAMYDIPGDLKDASDKCTPLPDGLERVQIHTMII